MTDDCNILSLGILAQTLSRPGGYEPKRYTISLVRGQTLSPPLIKAILCSDEDRIKKSCPSLLIISQAREALLPGLIWAGWQPASSFAAPPRSILRIARGWPRRRETVWDSRRPGTLWAAYTVKMKTGIEPAGAMRWPWGPLMRTGAGLLSAPSWQIWARASRLRGDLCKSGAVLFPDLASDRRR